MGAEVACVARAVAESVATGAALRVAVGVATETLGIAVRWHASVWRLSAPDFDGEHDDTVIAVALANHARLFSGNSYFVVREG